MLNDNVTPSYNPRAIVTKATNYTATVTDDLINVNGTYTITLPVISTLASSMLASSKTYKIVNVGTGIATVTPGTGDTLNGGSASITLTLANSYVIVRSDRMANNWVLEYPQPLVSGDKMPRTYQTVPVLTNGTTAVHIISSAGAPYALNIVGVTSIANDTVASNVVVKNGTASVCTTAKSTTVGVGVASTVANSQVAAGSAFTVESSGTGNCTVFVTFTAQ